eukprot:5270907-Prymnesium_polylepis.1
MSLLGMNAKARDPVTTEWDDIQRRLGNLPPLEQDEAAAEEDEAAAIVPADGSGAAFGDDS